MTFIGLELKEEEGNTAVAAKIGSSYQSSMITTSIT